MMRLTIWLALASAALAAKSAVADIAGMPSYRQVDTEYAQASSPFGETGRRRIGYGHLFTNDLIGDGKDRWRTGSLTSSRIYGYNWEGSAPARFGELVELRIQGQIIAPQDLTTVDPSDRPWAGALSVGLHSHMQRGRGEYALGADLVAIGPQTRLDQLQDTLHDLFGAPRPSEAMLAMQIPDKVRPTLVAEAGRVIGLGHNNFMRPFAEARAGDETLFRVGADFSFGAIGQGELLIRESVTGQRYRAVYDSQPGFSFTVGGDLAYVADSVYLPEDRGYELTSRRDRLRAGLHWQGRNASAFYGLTYLGEEFEGQGEGQLTGSVRVKLRF